MRDLQVHPREQRPRDRDARPRHLDRRRHHAAARAERRPPRPRGRRSCPAGPSSSGCRRRGGWVEGDATFVGPNPPGGAVITYYQRTRHLFGPLKLEVLDARARSSTRSRATKRRGLNRVSWSMRVTPPRVPARRAARLQRDAGAARRARAVHGAADEGRGGDRDEARRRPRPRAPTSPRGPQGAVRRGDARARALRPDERARRPDRAVRALAARGRGSRSRRRARGRLAAGSSEARKKIVATKEGGAITGEERLREHADSLYGAILSWEGRPARYQLERIDDARARARRRREGDRRGRREGGIALTRRRAPDSRPRYWSFFTRSHEAACAAAHAFW